MNGKTVIPSILCKRSITKAKVQFVIIAGTIPAGMGLVALILKIRGPMLTPVAAGHMVLLLPV